MSNYIFLIVGPSGTGKTTFTEALCEKGYKTISSYTTRPARHEGETGHIFVSKEEFDDLENKVAYTLYNGNEYCATQAQVDDADLYVIDPAGIDYFKRTYKGTKKPIVVYLKCPEPVRILRMFIRGDSADAIDARITTDRVEFKDVVYDIKINANQTIELMVREFEKKVKKLKRRELLMRRKMINGWGK